MKAFKVKKLPQDMSLQITSMADIFMILLVFLLKSYATSITTVTPSADTKLPIAHVNGTGAMIKDSLKIEIARGTLIVDQGEILKLNNLEFEASDLDQDGGSPVLLKALQDQRAKLGQAAENSSLLVLADQKTPYSTIKPILVSAATAGYVDLQLIVVESE